MFLQNMLKVVERSRNRLTEDGAWKRDTGGRGRLQDCNTQPGAGDTRHRRRKREMPTGSAEGPKLSSREGGSRGQGAMEAPAAENKQDSDCGSQTALPYTPARPCTA